MPCGPAGHADGGVASGTLETRIRAGNRGLVELDEGAANQHGAVHKPLGLGFPRPLGELTELVGRKDSSGKLHWDVLLAATDREERAVLDRCAEELCEAGPAITVLAVEAHHTSHFQAAGTCAAEIF
jgi:hypothetical protein